MCNYIHAPPTSAISNLCDLLIFHHRLCLDYILNFIQYKLFYVSLKKMTVKYSNVQGTSSSSTGVGIG